MDFDSSSKFIASLAKFLQSLCNGYVDFDKGVEVIGHIYINVDSDTGKKVDYVLNEKVCKNDNSITFISNSFHAQPAEKPKPPPKKAAEPDKQNDETVVMDDSGQAVPNSTNVGTLGSYRSPASRLGTQDSYSPGSKRPRSPLQRRGLGRGSPAAMKHGLPQSPRYQDSGGPAAKMGRSDIPQSPLNSGAMGGGGDEYEGANVFQSGGDEEDSQNYSSNFLEDQSSSEVDQKPVIDPDISIVKEEYMSNQSSCAYSGSNQTSGPGRGKGQPASAYPVMLHQNPSNFSGAAGGSSHQSEMHSGSSIEGAGDPSSPRELLRFTKPPRKSNAEKCKDYRKKLKEDPERDAFVRQRNIERGYFYRAKPVSDEMLARRREQARLRSKKYRDSKKARESSKPYAMPTPKTPKQTEEKRQQWREAKRSQRENWGPEKKQSHREKSLRYYHEHKAQASLERNFAVLPVFKQEPSETDDDPVADLMIT